MVVTRAYRFGLVGAALMLAGCQMVGPIAIDTGRDRYNGVLQSTTKQQAFENIIRVYKQEPTSFVDVTEVDATQTLTGTASGAVSGLGSKPGTFGTLGSITPGASYSETPLIHYVPLTGQGLVSQLVTPVGVDSLESLINSGWPAGVVLALASDYITPEIRYSPPALNIISVLADRFEVATLVAGKSELTGAQSSTENQSRGSSGSGPNNVGNANNVSRPPADDALTIFLHPPSAVYTSFVKAATPILWQRLLAIYNGTRANSDCPPTQSQNGQQNSDDKKPDDKKSDDKKSDDKKSGSAQSSPPCTPSQNSIELRTTAITPQQKTQNDSKTFGATPDEKMQRSNLQMRAPVLKTYSALGILRSATGSRQIDVVTPDRYREIHDSPLNQESQELDFYTLSVAQGGEDALNAVGKQIAIEEHLPEKLAKWFELVPQSDVQRRLFMLTLYFASNSRGLDRDFIHMNTFLYSLRRYVLIIKDDVAPADAYVAYPYQGKWYYIDGNDKVSQSNFNLIALFLTVMAVPSTTPQIGTAISVGGG